MNLLLLLFVLFSSKFTIASVSSTKQYHNFPEKKLTHGISYCRGLMVFFPDGSDIDCTECVPYL